MSKKIIAMLLTLVITFGAFAGCESKKPVDEGNNLQPATLTIAGSWEDCVAIEEIGREFTKKYSNCTVVYEYLQDYYTSLEKRMTGDNSVDLFFTTDYKEESVLMQNTLDLKTRSDVDLSQTYKGLINNFIYHDEKTETESLYVAPLGAEMRGLYVNKTLLNSLNIAVPANQAELLSACKTLKEKGYTPFQGNPGTFSQHLLYPWICNIIANSDDYAKTYDKVENREAGLSELFKEPFNLLYTLVKNRYYDYKTIETEENMFTDVSDEAYARYFLNITEKDDGFIKVDDVGKVAFMPSSIALTDIIAKTKEDYHSKIEYVFIPAPVSEDGGYVYLSPAKGIAVNKNSANLEWCVKFINFIFEKENNETFAKAFNIIPNTSEAFSYISSLYNVPANHITEVGKVTFSYNFYKITVDSLVDISKANNPKYMKEDLNGEFKNADGKAVSMYSLEYYLDGYEKAITNPKESATE